MAHSSKLVLRHPPAIRFFHWVNMISITLLTLTGFYIHGPLKFPLFSSMDVARTIHFLFMYILVFSSIGRIWYAIYTKDYKNVLFYRLQDVKNFWSLGLYYLFIKKTHPDYGKYNPGQKFMYTGVFIFIAVQAITGFILYMPATFAGAADALGGPIVVRMIHYCVTWIFILMVMIHVYLDIAEGVPVLKSIFTGRIPDDFHADVKTPMPEPKDKKKKNTETAETEEAAG